MFARHQSLKLHKFENKYVMSTKLGEGMHSQVFKCFHNNDTNQTKPFAVKVTRENDEEKKLAHRNEYKLISQINHPNIIKSIDLFENEFSGEINLVMQFIEGVELFDLLDSQFTERDS